MKMMKSRLKLASWKSKYKKKSETKRNEMKWRSGTHCTLWYYTAAKVCESKRNKKMQRKRVSAPHTHIYTPKQNQRKKINKSEKHNKKETHLPNVSKRCWKWKRDTASSQLEIMNFLISILLRSLLIYFVFLTLFRCDGRWISFFMFSSWCVVSDSNCNLQDVRELKLKMKSTIMKWAGGRANERIR